MSSKTASASSASLDADRAITAPLALLTSLNAPSEVPRTSRARSGSSTSPWTEMSAPVNPPGVGLSGVQWAVPV